MSKTVKLTESELQKIVNETVNQMLVNETSPADLGMALSDPTEKVKQDKPLGRAISLDKEPKKDYYGYLLNPEGKRIRKKIGEAVKKALNDFLIQEGWTELSLKKDN